jgi:octaprenyl-diphosphate synthase
VTPSTQIASNHSAVRTIYRPIQSELNQAEQRLRTELHNESLFVNELLQYGAKLGGKRIRPALLLLTAKASGSISSDHETLAAVIEMIHTATLVHDDILDEAQVRRHHATVNSRWNNETSVLLGDYLFTHAFYLASTLDTTYACRRIGQSTNIVCDGELRQVASRGRFDMSEEEYYAIIDGKTAELCACACHLGAYYADAEPHVVAAMERYGRSLGMAFQIADDLLDIVGEE